MKEENANEAPREHIKFNKQATRTDANQKGKK